MLSFYDTNGVKMCRQGQEMARPSRPSPTPPGPSTVPPVRAIRSYVNSSKSNMVEPLIFVRQIMSSPVLTIGKDISLFEAWKEMRLGGVQQLVVTERRRQVIGMVSRNDLLAYMHIAKDGVEMDRILPVADILSGETVTTDSMNDIRKTAKAMVTYHLAAMPVVDEDELVGIITRGDILRGFAEYPKLNLWA